MSRENLNKYSRGSPGAKADQKTTSINVLVKHLDFLKRRNLNLSLMVRDFLNKLISEEKPGDDGSEEL